MLWDELSAKNFPRYVKESGSVCILPVGVLEKHGNHLPLGTDMLIGQAVCKKAAEMEKAVVFPYYFLGQIAEARHSPGCISASHRLIMDALIEMCDEIHRNGFEKIIIYSSHGGNNYFLLFFIQQMPGLNRSYNLYHYFIGQITEEQNKTACEYVKTNDLGLHAGILETSLVMHLRPDLVDIKAQDPKECQSMGHLAEIRNKGIMTGFNWYAEYPHHIAGDPALSTPEFGKMAFDIICENLVNVIRAVKSDDMSEKLRIKCNSNGQKPV